MQRYGGRTPAERLKEYLGLSKEAPWHLQDIMVFSDIGAADSTLGNPGMFHASKRNETLTVQQIQSKRKIGPGEHSV